MDEPVDVLHHRRLLAEDAIAAVGAHGAIAYRCVDHYRSSEKYLLHEFVIMPNHIHLIVTPAHISIQRAMQLIKGGFSFRAGRELQRPGEIWQTSFHDRRIRDAGEYVGYRKYLHDNPVAAGLAATPSEFDWSSAHAGYELDEVPERLKPSCFEPSLQA